jgi:Mg/Co/Ni transporter MgtE
VYDYVAGKADWTAMAMPTDGTIGESTIQHRISQVPTCRLGESLSEVEAGLFGEWRISVVLDPERIVLGLLDLSTVGDSHESIEDLMKPAPLTLRPSVLAADALAHFEKSSLLFALVTKSTGELMGAIRKADLSNSDHRI